jgi:hypothetical protein
MRSRSDILAESAIVLLLALLPLLFFWRLITPFPADQMNITAGDFGEQYFPLRAFAAQEWVAGRIPLWNPYLYGGQPALADIQSGALYPPHVLQALFLGWVLPLFSGQDVGFPLKALEWQAIFHFSIAAVGTYLFGRYLLQFNGFNIRSARFGAVVAAIIFGFSGYLSGFPVQQLSILEVSAWLPWVLWTLMMAGWHLGQYQPGQHRAVLGRMLLSIAGGAAVFALAILAGHPQTVMYIFYLSLAYVVFLGFNWRPAGQSRLARMLWVLGVWLVTTGLGIMLSAAQLLPTLEFIGQSVRANMSYATVSTGLPLTELVTILYPGFFGGSPAYIGIAGLLLVSLALSVGQTLWLETGAVNKFLQLGFWAIAALVSLLLAFGDNLFVFPVAYLTLPGFDSVRQQERVFLVYSFSLATLAGFGAAMLSGRLPSSASHIVGQFERRLRFISVIGFFVAALFLYGATNATVRGDTVNLFYGVLWHHLFGLLMLAGGLIIVSLRPRRLLRRYSGMLLVTGWVAFNLFTVNWQYNLTAPEQVPQFTPNGVVMFLQKRVGASTEQVGRVSSGGYLPGGNSAASVYNLQDLTGNTPLQLVQMQRFFDLVPAWELWQLMNVRYVVDQRDIGDPGLQLVYQENETRVYVMKDSFERAWLVSEAVIMPDDDQALEILASGAIDLRRQAVVLEPLVPGLATEGSGQATVEKMSPGQLVLNTQSTGRMLLVLSETFYPGWYAVVDGQPAQETLKVNVVQQGVVLSGGEHTVELYYWPLTLTAGVAISGFALIICVGMVFLAWRFIANHR